VEKSGIKLLEKELSCIVFENLGSHFIENTLFILRTSDRGGERDKYVAFAIRYFIGGTR
jgi:hypothetical protein